MAEKKKAKKGSALPFKIAGEKIERTRSPCPKCGPGVFLGEHSDRQYCGRCHYTKWKK